MLAPLQPRTGDALFFWPHSVENRAALRTSIAAVLAVLLSFAFHLETPYWSGMTVVIVANLYTGSIIDKAMLRIMGTIAGAFLGYYVAGLVANSFLLYLLACFLIISVCVYYYHLSAYGYAYLLGALCAFIVISQLSIDPPNAFFVAIWRPVEIGLGVLISAISAYTIFPNHLKDNILLQVDLLFVNLGKEFTQLQDCLFGKEVTFADLTASNLALKKEIRKAVELVGVMGRELGTTHERIDEVRAILDTFYALTRQFQYLLITANEKIIGKALLKPVFRAIQHDLVTLKQAYATNTLTSITLETGDVVAQESLDGLDYNYVLFFNQVNHHLQTLVSLLTQKPTALQPQFKMINKQQRMQSDPDLIKNSIKAGLSVILALAFWLTSNWPGGINGIISSLLISVRKNLVDMKYVSIHRLVGCALGGGIALLSLFFFEFSIGELVCVMLLCVWGFTYFMFKVPYYSYVGLQANIALIISLAQEGGPPVLLDPPLQRLAGIVIGIAASFIVANVLWRSDGLTVLTRYLDKLYRYMGFNLEQVLLVSGEQKSLHDLANIFWIARGLMESLAQEQLPPKKQHRLDELTLEFESRVIIQATISHIISAVDLDTARATAQQLHLEIKAEELALVTAFQQHDKTSALKINQRLQFFLAGVEDLPAHFKEDKAAYHNLVTYITALSQLANRVQ